MQRYYGDVGGPPRIGAACPSDPIDCLQNSCARVPYLSIPSMHSFQMGKKDFVLGFCLLSLIQNQFHQLACCCWSTCSQPFSLIRCWESAAQLLWRTKCFNPSWTLGVRQPVHMASAIFVVYVSGYARCRLKFFVVWKLRQALRGFGSNFGAKWGHSLHGPITSNLENHHIIMLVHTCTKIADRRFNRWNCMGYLLFESESTCLPPGIQFWIPLGGSMTYCDWLQKPRDAG